MKQTKPKIEPIELVDKYYAPDDYKRWEVTDVVELIEHSLAEVVAKVKEVYSGDISIRISESGVLFNGAFYERNYDGKLSTLGMLVGGDRIGKRMFPKAPSELYFLRFNTESLIPMPPKRDYAGLTDLVKTFEWGRATS